MLSLALDIVWDVCRIHCYRRPSACNSTQNDLAGKNTSLDASRIISPVYLARTLSHARICYALPCFVQNQNYGTTPETFTALPSLVWGGSANASMRKAKCRALLKRNGLGFEESWKMGIPKHHLVGNQPLKAAPKTSSAASLWICR